MTNRAKAKGDRAERESVRVLVALAPDLVLPNAARMLGAGRKQDIGDLHVLADVAVQVRAYRNLISAVRSATDDSVVQAGHGLKRFALGMVLIPRARNTGPDSVRWLACVAQWPAQLLNLPVEFGRTSDAVAWLRRADLSVPVTSRIALVRRAGVTPIFLAPIQAWMGAYRTAITPVVTAPVVTAPARPVRRRRAGSTGLPPTSKVSTAPLPSPRAAPLSGTERHRTSMSISDNAGSFVHLHNHTSFSVTDGLAKLDDAAAAAAADNQPALAITDHGTLAGSWKFQKAALKAGIKAIHGQELYLAIGSRLERLSEQVPRDEGDADADDDESGKASPAGTKIKRYQHLTVLAKNQTGWANLVKITNDAQAHFWHKPRTDLDMLASNSTGLIVLTGCLGGPVAGRLLLGDTAGAEANLRRLIDSDAEVFVEVMEHGIGVERRVMTGLIELAQKYNLATVATNDAHYVQEGDADAHDAWLCVAVNGKVADPKRWRFQGAGYFLRSAAQMHELFDNQNGTERACQRTVDIAASIEDRVLPESKLRIPSFDTPPDYASSADFLHALVLAGARERFGADLPAAVRQRLRFEFDTIRGAGLEDYFLIVHDLISWARANGIRVGPGRGSAAGSLISYSLKIVNVDPLANNLLFERFLNPERAGMPDIDIDFDSAGRDRAVAYLVSRWGADRVARIGTFGMSLSRSALRSAARVLDLNQIGDELSRLVPITGTGKPATFAEMDVTSNAAAAGFRAKATATPEHELVVATARRFEGVNATEGVHACGVVISDEPLGSLIPLRADRRKGHDGEFVTQWDGKDIDDAGFLKCDVLGLTTLDIISACVTMIEATTGEIVDADNPCTDPADPQFGSRVRAAWTLVSAGKTAGIFQLESSGMTRLAQDVAPDSLDDLAALVALFRPGPLGMKMHERYAARKHGRESVDYAIFTAGSGNEAAEQAVIASVLGSTFGVLVFQEQVMRLGEVIAGFGPVERNRIQKAISKKLRSEMAAVGELFLAGATRETVDPVTGEITKIAFAESTAQRLWDAMKSSGDYSFNASHSYAYGWLAYCTAYLKASWPAQYGAAMLSVSGKAEQRKATMTALTNEGITICGPDINLGAASTTVDAAETVRLGLSEVKGVGSGAAWIVAERDSKGPFTSLADVLVRVKVPASDAETVPSKNLPTSAVEALIEAGALDAFGPRLGMQMVLRAARDFPTIAVPDAEWGAIERAARERSRLGLLLSDHPLVALRDQVLAWRSPNSYDRPQLVEDLAVKDGAQVLVVGVLAGWAEKAYSKGRMAKVILEGAHGSVEGVIWDEALQRLSATGAPAVGTVVVMRGQTRVRAVLARPAEDGAEQDAPEQEEEQLELTVWEVFSVPINDPGRFNLPPGRRLRLIPTPRDGQAQDEPPQDEPDQQDSDPDLDVPAEVDPNDLPLALDLSFNSPRPPVATLTAALTPDAPPVTVTKIPASVIPARPAPAVPASAFPRTTSSAPMIAVVFGRGWFGVPPATQASLLNSFPGLPHTRTLRAMPAGTTLEVPAATADAPPLRIMVMASSAEASALNTAAPDPASPLAAPDARADPGAQAPADTPVVPSGPRLVAA